MVFGDKLGQNLVQVTLSLLVVSDLGLELLLGCIVVYVAFGEGIGGFEVSKGGNVLDTDLASAIGVHLGLNGWNLLVVVVVIEWLYLTNVLLFLIIEEIKLLRYSSRRKDVLSTS